MTLHTGFGIVAVSMACLLSGGPDSRAAFAQSAQPENSDADKPARARQPRGIPSLAEGEVKFAADAKPDIKVKRTRTGHLLVQPVINGRDGGWWIFDTGAGICVVSTPHADKFALKPAGDIEASGVSGNEGVKLQRASTMVLGPMTLHDQPVIITDLSFLRAHLEEDIVGVIGYGVLSKCIAEFDIEAPRIALYDAKSYKLSNGVWSPMSLEGRIPTIIAKFEDREGRFRLDTGANDAVTFREPAVRKWKLLDGRELTDAKLGGVGGFLPAKRGQLAWFELAGFRHENLGAIFVTQAKGSSGSDAADGSIGAGLLKSYTLVLDYAGQRISFRPRDSAVRPAAP